jgi:hypothetical protein
MKTTMILLLASTIAACGSTTGIVKMDNDTFYVAKRSSQLAFGAPVEQVRDVYQEATVFCSATGKQVKTVTLEEVNQIFGRQGSASLKFQCADK